MYPVYRKEYIGLYTGISLSNGINQTVSDLTQSVFSYLAIILISISTRFDLYLGSKSFFRGEGVVRDKDIVLIKISEHKAYDHKFVLKFQHFSLISYFHRIQFLLKQKI